MTKPITISPAHNNLLTTGHSSIANSDSADHIHTIHSPQRNTVSISMVNDVAEATVVATHNAMHDSENEPRHNNLVIPDAACKEPYPDKTPLDESTSAQASTTPNQNANIDELFEREMLPHYKSLYRFAFKLTNDEDDANDLVQDTYLKAFRFIGTYEQGSNAKAWMFQILKNGFINTYRKAIKEPKKVDYEEAENYLNTDLASQAESIDGRQKLFSGLIGDEVAQALNTLPVDFRAVIILCDIEEFTYEEISKIVDIPIGTVRSRLHRARKMLRDMLIAYAVQMGYKTAEE